MTTRNTMKWLLVALFAWACDGNSRSTTSSGTGPSEPFVPEVLPPTTALPEPQPESPPEGPAIVSVLVRGVLNPGYTKFLLGVADVDVTVDGNPVEVDLTGVVTPVDLASGGTSLVGRFALPAPGKDVRIRIVLEGTGSFEGMGGGTIDARGLPIELVVPSDWLQPFRRSVMHVDLARSLVADGDAWVLLPDFQLFSF